VGPVGIFGVAQSAGKEGIIPLLYLLALISANLGVLNLIPFPALDGGRALLILIEKIKGSPVSHKIELAMNGVGFALLILLMVVVTVRDVRGLF
jgi:regulator of sigma E protease